MDECEKDRLKAALGVLLFLLVVWVGALAIGAVAYPDASEAAQAAGPATYVLAYSGMATGAVIAFTLLILIADIVNRWAKDE